MLYHWHWKRPTRSYVKTSSVDHARCARPLKVLPEIIVNRSAKNMERSCENRKCFTHDAPYEIALYRQFKYLYRICVSRLRNNCLYTKTDQNHNRVWLKCDPFNTLSAVFDRSTKIFSVTLMTLVTIRLNGFGSVKYYYAHAGHQSIRVNLLLRKMLVCVCVRVCVRINNKIVTIYNMLRNVAGIN